MAYYKRLVRLNHPSPVQLCHTRGVNNPTLHAYLGERGRQSEVAMALRVSKQSVNDWRRKGFVPPHHAAQLEAISGIPRTVLSPQFNWGTKASKAKPTPEAV